ncbi:VapE domain-containing protein [Bradyrhizobium sp. AUGA SZCCT0431]|uniref:VapE domain-containing protein n=1 Tax=Bradyrhizobium sp. AUGA SZCCT0431 TaxID=2807674 RepID=UPI001BAD1BB8|nr:VapE domain-containing protein [Bradyrhizobium sp. AUGA SZCCT0431]MBR1143689.1 bifunctional DNA primase/polymerase [Bradyrhizobium sp. AUGA SZCCT0431]
MTDIAQPIEARNAPSWLDYARWLASLGIHVFPLNPATRRPFANVDVAAALGWPEPPQGEGGLKFATTDAAAIDAWWTVWPTALIGIRTGSISGLYVLDVDRKNGKDGFATITANSWIIPNTVAKQTPSGGGHYYFSIPRGDRRRWKTDSGQIGKGLDRRGEDGYVVWYGANLSLQMAEPPTWMTGDVRIQNEFVPHERRKPLGTDNAPRFEDAVKALYSINPNEMNYDEWRNISCAFRQSASGLGVDDGLILLMWDGWCKQYRKNSSPDNEKLWRSIASGTELGWSYLVSRASPQTQAEFLFGQPTIPQTINGEVIAPLDGYPNIIATASTEGGKSTLIETVKLLHGPIRLAFDEFSQTIFAMTPLPWDRNGTFPRPWAEIDTLHAQLFANALFKTPGKDTVFDAVSIIARHNQFHQVRDYLSRLQWDGVERLPQMLARYFGAQQSPYIAQIGIKFMVGAVARIMRPGCQSDHVLVLEGSQGIQKSTSFRILAGDDWFTDELPDLQSKDAAIQLAGKWIIEVSELSALKRSDVETTKKFMSRRIDRYRAPYDKIASDHPRQCLFVATTNDEGYLKDQTGNRRFWPVKCSTIDVKALHDDRDQLWAEAIARFNRGEQWWLTGAQEQMARAEQEERRETDPWHDIVARHCAVNGGMPVSMDSVFRALNVPYERLNAAMTKRVAAILKTLGYQRRQLQRGGPWLYVK